MTTTFLRHYPARMTIPALAGRFSHGPGRHKRLKSCPLGRLPSCKDQGAKPGWEYYGFALIFHMFPFFVSCRCIISGKHYDSVYVFFELVLYTMSGK